MSGGRGMQSGMDDDSMGVSDSSDSPTAFGLRNVKLIRHRARACLAKAPWAKAAWDPAAWAQALPVVTLPWVASPAWVAPTGWAAPA